MAAFILAKMWWGYFWQGNESFVDDGIQIEPFNLDREREEGYFDNDGNFVEYVNDNDFKVQKHFTRLHSILNEELYIEFEIDFCRMHSLIVLMLSQNMLEKVLL